MTTSNFATAGNDPHAVAISRGVPRGWRGRRCIVLAPTWRMFKLTDAEFHRQYSAILAELEPLRVYRELGEDTILLCWEQFPYLCHRRLVAEWLESWLGIVIPELGHHRSESLPYLLMQPAPKGTLGNSRGQRNWRYKP